MVSRLARLFVATAGFRVHLDGLKSSMRRGETCSKLDLSGTSGISWWKLNGFEVKAVRKFKERTAVDRDLTIQETSGVEYSV